MSILARSASARLAAGTTSSNMLYASFLLGCVAFGVPYRALISLGALLEPLVSLVVRALAHVWTALTVVARALAQVWAVLVEPLVSLVARVLAQVWAAVWTVWRLLWTAGILPLYTNILQPAAVLTWGFILNVLQLLHGARF
jgi:hypothetical protein